MRGSQSVWYRPALWAVAALCLLSPLAASGPWGNSGPATPTMAASVPGPTAAAHGDGASPRVSGSNVTFNETGLPAATDWSVILNLSASSSTADAISFLVSNGTYS